MNLKLSDLPPDMAASLFLEGGVRGIQNDTPETNNIGMVVRELAKDLIEMDEKMLAEPNWKASDRQKYPRRDVDRAE